MERYINRVHYSLKSLCSVVVKTIPEIQFQGNLSKVVPLACPISPSKSPADEKNFTLNYRRKFFSNAAVLFIADIHTSKSEET